MAPDKDQVPEPDLVIPPVPLITEVIEPAPEPEPVNVNVLAPKANGVVSPGLIVRLPEEATSKTELVASDNESLEPLNVWLDALAFRIPPTPVESLALLKVRVLPPPEVTSIEKAAAPLAK